MNGGLYTGEAFWPDAPWRNFPATPDSGYLTNVALRSANPPHQATYHVPGGGVRPGNYTPVFPRDMVSGKRLPGLNMVCVPDSAFARSAASARIETNHGFSGFQYLQ